jgi:hypothetical protein
MPQRGLKSLLRDAAGERIVMRECGHGVEHQRDIRHIARHRPLHPQVIESRQAVAARHDAGTWP